MRRLMERGRLCAACCVVAILLAGLSSSRAEQSQAAPLSPKAVEALQLLESSDPYKRELGFLRLEALREPASVEFIKRYAANKDPEVRAYALRALAAIEGPAAIPALLDAFKRDKQSRVRRAVLLGLEPLRQASPDVDLVATFINALRDPKPDVRMTAVDIVSRIDEPRARDAIQARQKREHHRDVRRVLALAKKRMSVK